MNGSALTLRVAGSTLPAMLAFAGNSLLCRIALRDTAIDPARIAAGHTDFGLRSRQG
jgi:hypothetical protein